MKSGLTGLPVVRVFLKGSFTSNIISICHLYMQNVYKWHPTVRVCRDICAKLLESVVRKINNKNQDK